MKGRKLLTLGMGLILAFSCLAECKQQEAGNTGQQGGSETTSGKETPSVKEYPNQNLSGIISFNPGGATDIMARIIGPEMEKDMGYSVIMENKAGASGATATESVLGQPADGNTILFTSEVCNMWQALSIADIDCLKDLQPLMVYGGSAGVLVTQPDFQFETYEDMLAYAKENPGKVTVASAGIGTNIDAYIAMMKVIHGVEFNIITYGSEGDCRTALLGGEVDFTICNNFTALTYIQDGSFVCKAIFGDEEIAGYEGIPLLCTEYPDFKKYLPWGSYIVSFVHADTSPEIIKALQDASVTAYNSEAFQSYLETNGVLGYGLVGKEAEEYIQRSRSIVWYLYYDNGSTQVNPADYGVERVQ